MLPPGRVAGTVQRFPVLAEEVLPLPLRQRAQRLHGHGGSCLAWNLSGMGP